MAEQHFPGGFLKTFGDGNSWVKAWIFRFLRLRTVFYSIVFDLQYAEIGRSFGGKRAEIWNFGGMGVGVKIWNFIFRKSLAVEVWLARSE